MNTIPFRKLSRSELTSRGMESGPAYAEYLRESSPMGSVVAVNVLTGEYVVGGGSPQALYMYRDVPGHLRQKGRAQYVARTDPLAHHPSPRRRDRGDGRVFPAAPQVPAQATLTVRGPIQRR